MSEWFAQIGLRSAVVVLSVVLTVLVLAVAILPSASVADDNHTMQVRGYVYDDHGNKIANADVTVTMYNGLIPGVSKAATSSASPIGYFSVNFASGEWATGNTILVVAQHQGGLQGSNDTAPAVDGANFYEWENVTLPYEIPQFGNTTGLLVTAGLVGVVASVALVWRRTAK
jgi:hypothetical protein